MGGERERSYGRPLEEMGYPARGDGNDWLGCCLFCAQVSLSGEKEKKKGGFFTFLFVFFSFAPVLKFRFVSGSFSFCWAASRRLRLVLSS